MEKLSAKHKLFVEAYDGDTLLAMRSAGYTGADNYLVTKGNELLANPIILEAIRDRSKYSAKTLKLVATREERQAFWTSIMRNSDPYADENQKHEKPPLQQRLKASELLGKSEVDFIERLDVHHNVSISDIIQESYKLDDDTDIDAIEAEYERRRTIKHETQKEPIDTPFTPIEAKPASELEDFI